MEVKIYQKCRIVKRRKENNAYIAYNIVLCKHRVLNKSFLFYYYYYYYYYYYFNFYILDFSAVKIRS